IFVNGKRFIPLGGNWGFSENHLNYRAREYDIAVGYHRDMNFTMIRNWVGQTGDEEFYDACDRYGIMVWQDFWLANPADGPDPKDEEMFVRNAKDYVYRIRQHLCIALYCGRNEGYPPATLNEQLKDLVAQQHPGMLYIPSSADDGVSGHGPYSALTAKEYFKKATPKLHTERGMPNIMTFEGLSRTLRKEHLWPQNNFWGQHDFTMQGAQKGSTFNLLTEQALGASSDAADFTTKAQWINYNGYRAMYESNHQTRSGLLIWMSHPAFPSMTWQTYDYYFEPTAAYFACKKACEPLHLQWNAATDSIQLVNLYVDNCKTMTATAEILDMYGKPVWKQTMKVCPMADSTTNLMLLPKERLTTDVGFVRLSLTDQHSKSLYNNIYVFGKEENNYQSLNNLPKTTIKQMIQSKGNTSMRVVLKNTGKVPALMVRLNLVGEDGEQILPVHYSDNYFHLMPGEEKLVDISWKKEDARGMNVSVKVCGYHQMW
ncbi:MAG: beta-glycosidase, partial [Prevotella sp.]|nr:beta-glycosidase [Prevotella sp.]